MKNWISAILFISVVTSSAFAKKELWVYATIYKEFLAELEKGFEAKHPEIDLQTFQAGSEKIQAKIEAELTAKKVQADVLLVSDPFWAADLNTRGLLLKQTGGDSVLTNYNSLMVLVTHKNVPPAERPTKFSDLENPRFKNLVQMGSPLESGTAFSTVAYLSRKYGWDYFKTLAGNRIASAGGNSTVIQKVESGEKKIGVVLLENALAAIKRGSPLEIIYPTDGSIPIPSVQVIMKDTKSATEAKAFADYVLSKEGQEILRSGYMYSVRKDVAAPEGAKLLSDVIKNSTAWTPDIVTAVAKDSKNIKKKFSELVLE